MEKMKKKRVKPGRDILDDPLCKCTEPDLEKVEEFQDLGHGSRGVKYCKKCWKVWCAWGCEK